MKYLAVWLLTAILLLCGCAGSEEPAPTETLPILTEAPTELPTEAPTAPPTEPPTEAPTEAPTEPPADEDLVRLRDFIPEIREDLAYASENNFTGQKI